MALSVPRRFHGVLNALLVSNVFSIFLLLARAVDTQTGRYSFLVWNLMLAWLPLIFIYWLYERLKTSRWSEPGNIVLSLLWLGFLPNSFYLLSDLIHLVNTGEVNLLYDVVMLFSFIINAYTVGYISLFLMHHELLKRLKRNQAHLVIAAILLICSFAIYLGRYLRWNTWDVLLNPAGLLFDVSDRIINPIAHPQAFVTTLTFFGLLGSLYIVIWELAKLFRTSVSNKR